MAKLLNTHPLIQVDRIKIPIRKLINASKRIILSNVYATILHQLILNALHELGIKTTSQISHMKFGFPKEQFAHILSFRRRYTTIKRACSITVTLENTTFRIFITDDTETCFQCHRTGYFSNRCKNKPDKIHVIDDT